MVFRQLSKILLIKVLFYKLFKRLFQILGQPLFFEAVMSEIFFAIIIDSFRIRFNFNNLGLLIKYKTF